MTRVPNYSDERNAGRHKCSVSKEKSTVCYVYTMIPFSSRVKSAQKVFLTNYHISTTQKTCRRTLVEEEGKITKSLFFLARF